MRGVSAHGHTHRPRVLLDHELRIVRANWNLCHLFGVLPEHLIGSRVEDWINVDPALLYRLRMRIRNGPMPWHVILKLRLCGLRVVVDSQALQPLRSCRNGYLLISLANLEVT